MRNLRRKISQDVVPVDHYEFYSYWYYPVLRELACIIEWNGDYGKLAKAVNPAIKKSEARKGFTCTVVLPFMSQIVQKPGDIQV